MKFKDKSGNELTGKEAMQRWKRGMQSVTPLQQTKISLIGSIIMFIGVITGIIAAIVGKLWWLLIIMCGSFILIGVGLLGTLQKYWALKRIDNAIKMAGGINEIKESTNGS